jgi:hypothetical protein
MVNLLADNFRAAIAALRLPCCVGPVTPSTLAMRFGSGKLDVTLSLRLGGLWAYLSIS